MPLPARRNPFLPPCHLPLPRFVMAAMLALSALSSYASDTVLIEGGGVSIHTQDVQAEMQRMPEVVRERFLNEPDQLRELVHTLHLRKALAAQAQAKGLEKSPETARMLSIARESILAEA